MEARRLEHGAIDRRIGSASTPVDSNTAPAMPASAGAAFSRSRTGTMMGTPLLASARVVYLTNVLHRGAIKKCHAESFRAFVIAIQFSVLHGYLRIENVGKLYTNQPLSNSRGGQSPWRAFCKCIAKHRRGDCYAAAGVPMSGPIGRLDVQVQAFKEFGDEESISEDQGRDAALPMTTICPHCRSVRPTNATVPDWQCPSCDRAYVKAGSGDAARVTMRPSQTATTSSGFSIPWGTLLMGLLIVYGGWMAYHKMGSKIKDGISHAGQFGSDPSAEQLAQLAASRQPSDVLIYSAPWCTNCSAAKNWMNQYGFKYEVCDVEASSDCGSQLLALDPKGGVPYLIVRGQHMKEGFNSRQFLVALAK
jgi:glutaredoxin